MQYEDALNQLQVEEQKRMQLQDKLKGTDLPARKQMHKTTYSEATPDGNDDDYDSVRPDTANHSVFNGFPYDRDDTPATHPSLYNQKGFDSFQPENYAVRRKSSIASEFNELLPEPNRAPVEAVVQEIHTNLEDEPGDDQPLPPLNYNQSMNFAEFCRRWRLSQRNELERIRLIQYVSLIVLYLVLVL